MLQSAEISSYRSFKKSKYSLSFFIVNMNIPEHIYTQHLVLLPSRASGNNSPQHHNSPPLFLINQISAGDYYLFDAGLEGFEGVF